VHCALCQIYAISELWLGFHQVRVNVKIRVRDAHTRVWELVWCRELIERMNKQAVCTAYNEICPIYTTHTFTIRWLTFVVKCNRQNRKSSYSIIFINSTLNLMIRIDVSGWMFLLVLAHPCNLKFHTECIPGRFLESFYSKANKLNSRSWTCIQCCCCHCHSLSLASVNTDWFYLSGTCSPG